MHFPEILDEKTAGHCHLSLELSLSAASWCVLDLHADRYVTLGASAFSDADYTVSSEKYIKKLMACLPAPGSTFRSVGVSFISLKSILIPEPLFDKQMLNSYITGSEIRNKNITPRCDSLKQYGIINVYLADSKFTGDIRKSFPAAQVHHHATIVIASLFRHFSHMPGNNLYLYFDTALFHIILLNEKSLIFFNSFQFQKPEDVVYYSLFTCEQLKLDPTVIPVTLMGAIEKDSEMYALLHRYIKNIRLGIFKPALPFSPSMSRVELHRHFRIMNQYFFLHQ